MERKDNKRIALLSNVNVVPVALELQKDGFEVWEANGFGEIIGPLLDGNSGIQEFAPGEIYIVVDISALVLSALTKTNALHIVSQFIESLDAALPANSSVFISDAICRYLPWCGDLKENPSRELEAHWANLLEKLCSSNPNVFQLPISDYVIELGKNEFFSEKLWYLARLPYAAQGQHAIAQCIARTANRSVQKKKLLALDLDNTLWGGVLGELGPLGIELSDEHLGLIYKDVQREIMKMHKAGVLLALVSKNNSSDVEEVFAKNGHMVIKRSDVTAEKVSWDRKDNSLSDLAKELNLGLYSFVFLDDNPSERELMRGMLPEVTVIDFPEDISELPALLRRVYKEYFRQDAITREDIVKTEQYAANAKRSKLEAAYDDFGEYLKNLEIRASLVDPVANINRVAQLIGKTNQFNLTVQRPSLTKLTEEIDKGEWVVYAFDVSDRFGDNGITAIVVVDVSLDVPLIRVNVMSCRIMGKHIEDAILRYVEKDLKARGYSRLRSEFVKGEKNAPVADFYLRMGYTVLVKDETHALYELDLLNLPERDNYVKGLE